MRLWAEKGVWSGRGAAHNVAAVDPADIRRIGVIKHAAYGDLILTRPFLVLLRETFPEAHITLGLAAHYQRGAPLDLVDRVHVSKGHGENRTLRGRIRDYRSFGDQDLLFDLSGTNRSRWMTRFNSARVKVGYRHRGVERLLYDVAVPRGVYRFEAETFLDLLRVFGIGHAASLRYAMPASQPPVEGDYIVYFPTASTSEKTWPPECFSQLIRRLHHQYPEMRHIVLPGIQEWEKRVAREVIAGTGLEDDVALWADLEAPQALVAHARLLVANDTGIRHLAIACGTPTVCPFRHGSPFRYTPDAGPHYAVHDWLGGEPGLDAMCTAATAALGASVS